MPRIEALKIKISNQLATIAVKVMRHLTADVVDQSPRESQRGKGGGATLLPVF